MRTLLLAVGCLGILICTATARAAALDLVGVPPSLFREFDKNKDHSLGPAELPGAVEKWKRYVRGRIGGDGLRKFEARVSQTNPDGDGDLRVTFDEFRQFAYDSLGIPLPQPVIVAPPAPFPAGNGGAARDPADKKDRDDKDERQNPRGGMQQPRDDRPRMDDHSRGNDDRSRTAGGGNNDRSNFSGGGNNDRSHFSGGGNSDRSGFSGGGNSDRNPRSHK